MDMLEKIKQELAQASKTPSPDAIKDVMRLFRSIIFPAFYPEHGVDSATKIAAAILTEQGVDPNSVEKFVAGIPEIRELIFKDVAAIAHNDPAVMSASEIVLSYPAVTVMLHYRVAHALLKEGVQMIPRMITEMAHSSTGIDIHPAAQIGEYFAIDHGTGIVIGATSIIGNHVMLYQGVTLGARNFSYDTDGKPIDKPRHPILEDNVTVFSNTSILGRVRVGHDTIVGGNVWLTHDVPPYSRILQTQAVTEPMFGDGGGI